jgi:hypothetical protein
MSKDSNPPILDHAIGQPSAFTVKRLIEDLRRIRKVPNGVVPPVCILEFDEAGSAEVDVPWPPPRLVIWPFVRSGFRTAIQRGCFHRWRRQRDMPPIIGPAPVSASGHFPRKCRGGRQTAPTSALPHSYLEG